MNTFKKSFTLLLFSLIGSHCIITASNAAGYIKVREADGIRECSIPATVGDHAVDRRGCTNDQAYTVKFVDVPSALNITFFDDKKNDYCLDDEGWEIEVRTIKNPTTTDYIDITAMANVPNDTLVEPGILKIRYRQDGQVHGKLSCVRIENDK
ncbi:MULTISPECIES: hypothetical protein [unclassified Pseudomonas]|uniref:hypothetical protein n=1 Tax=unclassified Pseudomonas TaxID=196821 RepID=UPI0030DB9A58